MNVLIVHAHPEPRSFASALKDAAVEEFRALGHEVRVSDLYAMSFEPRLSRADFLEAADAAYFKPQREQMHATERRTFAPDVQAEIDRLLWAELVLFTFPLWWFSLPAILKGWVDRVFAMGAIYGGGKVHETGVLRGRRALLAVTTGGPAASYAQGGRNGDLRALLAFTTGGPPVSYGANGRNGALRSLLSHVEWGMLHFAGFEVLAPFVAYGPARATDEDRAAILAVWRERLRAIEHETPETLAPLGS
jgi:NAD(P)H dehydrogenase (quinone)